VSFPTKENLHRLTSFVILIFLFIFSMQEDLDVNGWCILLRNKEMTQTFPYCIFVYKFLNEIIVNLVNNQINLCLDNIWQQAL
jgi:hypothetical protein